MDILKLFIVFCVIILVMWLKKPISIAVLAATVVTILIYRLPIAAACSAMVKGATSSVSYTHLTLPTTPYV